MERKKPLTPVCFYTSCALSLAGMILRTVCMLTEYDASLGYFDSGVLPTISSILYYIAALAAILTVLPVSKDEFRAELCTPHRAPFAYVMGLVLALFTVFTLITSYAVLFTGEGGMRTALTLMGLAAASYFMLSASHHGRFRDGLVWLSFLPIVWCLLAVAVTYSDPYVAMNSPLKLDLQLGLLGFMLILTSEIRYRLGKAHPRGAVVLTSMGVFFSLNAGLPILLSAPRIGDTLYPLCAGVLLFAGIYGGYMLFCYTHALDCTDKATAVTEASDPED